MEMTDEVRDRIRAYIHEFLTDAALTDADIEDIAAAMPAAFHFIAQKARGNAGMAPTDRFLRSLPDGSLASLLLASREFIEWADMQKPGTWNTEILFLAAQLFLDEKGADGATRREIGGAALRLTQLTLIEWRRRNGHYHWVDQYSILNRRGGPRRIAARGSQTEH